MQGKAAYDTPLWWALPRTPGIAVALAHRAALFEYQLLHLGRAAVWSSPPHPFFPGEDGKGGDGTIIVLAEDVMENSTRERKLLLAGFSDTQSSEAGHSAVQRNLHGRLVHLSLSRKSQKVYRKFRSIYDDSDLIDEDSLLTEEDLKKPQLPSGDAFRCNTCPYKGLPPFKLGEKVTLSENFLDADI
ncbi:hypothetical protein BC332_00992 [Capsicum chinense]|nr:hypothetical protein BC332_00992 [Capsicum chinense]